MRRRRRSSGACVSPGAANQVTRSAAARVLARGGILLAALVARRSGAASAFSAAATTTRGARLSAAAPISKTLGKSFTLANTRSHRASRIRRRLFDTGGFFGVGVPEATVVALLAWFLLGPEELFRLAKAAGSWLGEARGFVGEAAKKYESTLDDASTRKAIAGIRETQRTVSEVASSFQAISGTIRDPLNLSSTLSDTFAKYDDKKEETSKSSSSTDAQASKPQQPSGAKEETPEELERKRAASQNSAKDLFFSGATKDASSAIGSEDVLARLDARLEQVDRLVEELEELKKGVLRDQETVRVLMDPSPSAKKPELAGTAAASPEQTKAHEPAKKPARALE